MVRWPAVGVALCLLAAAAVAGVGVATAPPGTSFDLDQQFDRAQFRITVHSNGSARWTFRFERTLANASEREQFQAFAETFNENETRLYRDFQNQSETLVERGQSATGREMSVHSFARQATVTTQLNDVGVVEMAFTWTGFASTEDARVIVGDVFEGGLYVGPDQALVIRAGEGLEFRAVEPPGTLSGGTLADSDTVTWQGERTFADNHPRVVLAPPGAETPTTVDGPGDTDGGDGTRTAVTDTGAPLWPVGLVLAVVVVALGAFLYRRRSPGPVVGGPGSGPTPDEAALMDDEDRIADLLQERGGRMRQSDIVDETGWSKSKVSMVLTEMADDGEIRKLRVGRENIISLPGHEPDAAGPPREDTE